MVATRTGIIESVNPPLSLKLGNGLRFASGKSIQTTFNSVIARSISQAQTWSFWLKTGTLSGFQIFQEFATNFQGMFVRFNGTALEFGVIQSGVGAYYFNPNTGITFSDNTLYHIVIGYNGGGINRTNFSCYVNSVSQAASLPIGSPTITDITPTQNLNLGGRGGSFNLNGYLYDVALFSSFLTESEIKLIYNNNVYPNTQLLRLKLEEHSGTSVADSSGNGLTTNLSGYSSPEYSLGASNYHVDWQQNPLLV